MPTVRRKSYTKTVRNKKAGTSKKVRVKSTTFHRTDTPHYRKPKR